MNYLQFIDSIQQNQPALSGLHFLVSGVDSRVRCIIGQDILSSSFARGKILLVVNNIQNNNEIINNFGQYRIVNALDGKVSLCPDLLNVNSIDNISRLRTVLADLEFDTARTMRVITYLKFISETEKRLNGSVDLSISILEQYGSVSLVQNKLKELVKKRKISSENYNYLLERYSEVSSAAADFENVLVLLSPFLGDMEPQQNMALMFPIGKFTNDKPMQEMLCKFLTFYAAQNVEHIVILILDDGNGQDRKHIINILKSIHVNTEVHMFSNDAFSLDDDCLSVIMNAFQVRIYTRHSNMLSCEKISQQCGQIDVVKHSSTITIDRRFRANSAWDMLLGTNRTETSISNAPVKEYRFQKEQINSFLEGTGIVDYEGNKVLFSF